MISWPKAIANAGGTRLHCSSCTALAPLTRLRMIHIFSPFPPVPHVMWSPCAQAQNSLLFAVMVFHGLIWPLKLQCSSVWALAEQPFSSPAPARCVPAQTHIHVFTSLLLPLLDIFPCCLWISPSLACFMEMLLPLLHLTPSFKISPLVFCNFKFLLVSYQVAIQECVMEVAEAQAAHLSYSSILSLLHPWVSYFVSANYFGSLVITWVNYFACFPVQKWNSLWSHATVNHKEHKLSFQNVLCPRDLIANSQIPSLCPYIFGPLWEGLMIQPRFLKNSFVLSLAGHGAGKEIILCFLRWDAACALTPGQSHFLPEITHIGIVMFAWCKEHQKKKEAEQSLKLGHRWAPHGSSSNPLKASVYVWLPWCVEKAK